MPWLDIFCAQAPDDIAHWQKRHAQQNRTRQNSNLIPVDAKAHSTTGIFLKHFFRHAYNSRRIDVFELRLPQLIKNFS